MFKKRKSSTIISNIVSDSMIRSSKTFMPNSQDSRIFSLENWSNEPEVYETNQDKGAQKISQWRLMAYFAGTFLVLLILVSRLWYLQIIHGKENLIFSDRNRLRVETIAAPRGVIYSYDNQIIARNTPAFRAVIVPALIKESQEASILEAAQILKMTPQDLMQKLENSLQDPYRDIVIKNNISRDEQLALSARDIPGIEVVNDVIRDYPFGDKLAHIIGYTTEINQEEIQSPAYQLYHLGDRLGRGGIEETYQDRLYGQSGKKMTEVDAFGKPQKLMNQIEPQAGQELHLTIDAQAQEKAYELLKAGMQKYQASGGSVIIEDIQTGAIRAMVNLPSFDPNLFAKGISQTDFDMILSNADYPLINRAITGTYPPGSTVKMAIGAQALEDKVITPETQIDDRPGVIRIGEWEFPDWTIAWGLPQFGPMNLVQALGNSSDIFFYTVGGGHDQVAGLGEEGLAKAMHNFGFGATTQIDLPQESEGLVPTPSWKETTKNEPWFLGNTYHMAIGQGDVLVTPIQLNNYIAAIANNGKRNAPYLVESVLGADGSPVYAHTPTLLSEIPIAKENINTIKEGMRAGTTFGIIWPLKETVVPVAAKTGTAEFGIQNEKGEYETHAWVTGYAPYDNPKIAFTIFLEAGQKSNNASEVARDLVNWYFSH